MNRYALLALAVILLQACAGQPPGPSLDAQRTPAGKINPAQSSPTQTSTTLPSRTPTALPSSTPVPTATRTPTRTVPPTPTPTATPPPLGGGRGIIYYVHDGGIYQIRPDGSENKLIKSIGAKTMILGDSTRDGNILTYQTAGTTCRLSAEGKSLGCAEGWGVDIKPDGAFEILTSFFGLPQGFGGRLSPKGGYLAGDVKVKEPNHHDIVIFNTATRESTTIMKSAGFISWSPDGSGILVSKWQSAKRCSLLIILDQTGEDRRQLSGCWYCGAVFTEKWSPQSDQIAIRSSEEQCSYSVSGGDLWVIDVNSTNRYQITSGIRVFGFDWSPDGKYLVLTGNKNSDDLWDLYIVERETRTVNMLKADLNTSYNVLWR